MKTRNVSDAVVRLKNAVWRSSARSPRYGDAALRLYSGAGVAFMTQLLGYALAYVANILYARWMGPLEYGLFSYISTWALLLAALAAMEFPTVLLRFASEYLARADWASFRGLLLTSRWTVCLSGGGVAMLCVLVSYFLSNYADSPYAAPLAVGAWIIPLWSLVYLHNALGRVLGKILTAYAPTRVLKPALMILFGFLYVSSGRKLTATALMGGTIVVLGIALVSQWLSLARWPRKKLIRSAVPATHAREWFRVAFSVLLASSAFILLNQTNTILIGIFLTPEEVALYSAAAKTSQLMDMPAMAMAAYAVPMFASAFASGDRKELQEVLLKTVTWSFWPAVAIALVLGTGASFFLGLFGSDFLAAKPAVIILAFGGLINAGGGPVLVLMQVTGHQREAAVVIGCSAGIGAALSFLGIYFLGFVGAAVATAMTSAIWIFWLNLLVAKQIGVNASIFCALKKRFLF